MLDISKLLAGVMGGGQDAARPVLNGAKAVVPPLDPIKAPIGQTPDIIYGGAPTDMSTKPAPIGATPGINPDAAPPPLSTPMPQMAPTVKPEVTWKDRMMGGLQGLQSASAQQSKAPPMAPMDMEQIKQMQFAHQRNGGIIRPQGRY